MNWTIPEFVKRSVWSPAGTRLARSGRAVWPRSAKNSTKRRRISAAGSGWIRGSRSVAGRRHRPQWYRTDDQPPAARMTVMYAAIPLADRRDAVTVVATLLVLAVAAIHVYILVLEMFLWRTERGRRAFGTDQAFADASATLAANQGLYNGILAAGLVWGAFAADPVGFQVELFFLGAVAIAGDTVRRRSIAKSSSSRRCRRSSR